ncbi:MAG: FAD:protein transferase [Chloroflexota bacterium]|jgi:thiamine biosynthesis lipoprotein|nr:FAD:protein transferase [Chloroflexota bacterium]
MTRRSSPRSIAPVGDVPAASAAGPANATRVAGGNRVEHIMGTAISFDLRGTAISPAAVDAAFDHLREVDARFSPFIEASEISRLGRREITLEDCSIDVQDVLRRCEELRVLTNGFFDIHRHRADGRVDPSGYVKGWAVEAAAAILDAAGATSYCFNAGGDVIARGEPEPGRTWRIGIRHPEFADRVAAVIEARDAAVATSAAYERPGHIVDPHRGRPPVGILSVTVVGPSLATADAYATAAFAMGAGGLAWLAGRTGYEGLAIGVDRRLTWTPGFERYRARP